MFLQGEKMKETKSKKLTIFLVVLIGILFALSIIFTIIKNDLRAKDEYYRNQNQIITEQLKD